MRFGRLKRREFITLLSGAAMWPLAARAQQARHIGVLMNASATETVPQSFVAAFVLALRQLGWVEGQNVRIDLRWNAGDAQLARTYAAQLIGLTPDVILSASTTNLTILQQATSTVPIVFVQVSDPVVQGFVSNLARPGSNITGFSSFEFSIGGKCVELLKEVVPDLARVAVMFNPDTSPQTKYFLRAIEAAAQSFGVQVATSLVRTLADIEPAIEGLARSMNGGLILPTDSFTQLHHKLIVDFAARYRLPAISLGGGGYDFAEAGGLMQYGQGAAVADQYRQAAAYIDRILKGAKAGDLPIQLATSYPLLINRKTATALGLEIPPKLLFTAEKVIE
jgi:putative tryptophan/tyrosine transport system substrate-binding protein